MNIEKVSKSDNPPTSSFVGENTHTSYVQLRIQHALTTMQQNFHIFFHCMQTQRFIGICVAWASPRVGRWAVMSSQGFRPGFQCEEMTPNIM